MFFKRIFISFLIALAMLVAVIEMQPSTYSVTRSAMISAPPAIVFENIDDFHKWQAWSPWANIDPGMKQAYSGPAAGVGAEYRWSGNERAGEGAMVITESRPNEHVGIELAFTRPYVSSSVISLGIQPQGSGSVVTWNMTGKNNFALKALAFFSSVDRMIGPDFERGLAQLKSVAEAATGKQP